MVYLYVICSLERYALNVSGRSGAPSPPPPSLRVLGEQRLELRNERDFLSQLLFVWLLFVYLIIYYILLHY